MDASRNFGKRLGLWLGPALFLITLLFFCPEGLSQEGIAVLAATLWIASWWISEAIPIPATALLPVVLFPLSSSLSVSTATEAYGHPLIFLFLGGFMIAVAIERWGLHRRIALHIIRRIGSSMSRLVLGFMLACGFLSMWISNTATAVMMLPIGTAILSGLEMQTGLEAAVRERFSKALLLGIAYSASIGGIATLIGTPPNLVLAAVVRELYGVEISFARWMLFGLPIAAVLLLLCWLYLTRIAFTVRGQQLPGGAAEIERQLAELGPMSGEEKRVLIVFVLTALAWVSRSFLLEKILPGINDTVIAIAGALALFVWPPVSRERGPILDWESAVRLPWGIILLFGGGLALAAGFEESGLAAWLAGQMSGLKGVGLAFLLLVVVGSVNFLTEITSNVATTSMILPVLAPMAVSLGTHPYSLMFGATIAASCAFMLPVATPPNAVVFGSGHLRIPDMVRTGLWLNVLSIALILLAVFLLLPWVWGISLAGSMG